MNVSRLVFIVISILIIVRVYLVKDTDAAIAISLGVLISGTMIWFTGFWTSFLGFGFIESMARDSRKPENSSAAIKFLGWVILLILAGCVLFL